MLTIRKANERGRADHGWLKSHHTFSFADYYDPAHMGFGQLRVINDDHIAPDRGFGTHPHRDMEIITYVLDGALAHKDSMGNGSEMRPGDVQRMSAGTGVTHSEFNPSPDTPVHLRQIWILPDARGLEPGYEQKHFSAEQKRGQLRLLASKTGRDGAVSLNQDVDLYAGLLTGEETMKYSVRSGRDVWVHVARGALKLNGESLEAGDGASITESCDLTFTEGSDAEVLVFDMARTS